jgi:heat shock protein HslJ
MHQFIFKTLVFFLCLLSVDAQAQKQERFRKDTVRIVDSIEYYEVEIDVNQKNYMSQLAGSWTIDTMRRQARAVPEALSNVTISFDTDSTFSGSTGCNKVTGAFRLKGTSIKFLTINSTKMACEHLEREAVLQSLLSQTVSAYTVTNDILLLRDGASNVVFRGHRKKD